MDRSTLLLAIETNSSPARPPSTSPSGWPDGTVQRCRSSMSESVRVPLRVPPVESHSDAAVLVADAVRRIQLSGLLASGRVRSGPGHAVGHLIVDEAATRGCGAIVLGSFRLRGVRRIAGHGVRDCVMRHTALPVFITPTALSFGRLVSRSVAP